MENKKSYLVYQKWDDYVIGYAYAETGNKAKSIAYGYYKDLEMPRS